MRTRKVHGARRGPQSCHIADTPQTWLRELLRWHPFAPLPKAACQWPTPHGRVSIVVFHDSAIVAIYTICPDPRHFASSPAAITERLYVREHSISGWAQRNLRSRRRSSAGRLEGVTQTRINLGELSRTGQLAQEGFQNTTAPAASGWSDLAGWDSHPLESAALSRRTREADIAERDDALSASKGTGEWHCSRDHNVGRSQSHRRNSANAAAPCMHFDAIVRPIIRGY